MEKTEQDMGVAVALIERFESQRLPRALKLKEKVAGGGLLSEEDISFLEQVFSDASDIGPLVERNPSLQKIATQAISLYREITEMALKNEQGQ